MKKAFKLAPWGAVILFLASFVTLMFIPQESIFHLMTRFDLLSTATAAGTIPDLQGTTGKIGQEDIEFGTGRATDTFTVSGYSGGTVTLTRLPAPFANVASLIKGKWYVSSSASITNHGDASVQGSYAWVIAQIGATNCAIELPPATYVMSSGSAIPSNVVTILQPGAQIVFTVDYALNGRMISLGGTTPPFSVATGKTLTVNAYVDQPGHQLFTGLGSVKIYNQPILVDSFSAPSAAFAAIPGSHSRIVF
jgi:hypothetical protein